jgi:hypothetical protein
MTTAIRITSANSVDPIMQIVIIPFIIESSIIGCIVVAPFEGLFFISVVIPSLFGSHPHHAAAADEH